MGDAEKEASEVLHSLLSIERIKGIDNEHVSMNNVFRNAVSLEYDIMEMTDSQVRANINSVYSVVRQNN